MAGYVLNCVLFGILSQAIFISAKIPDWVTDDMIAMAADDKARCMGIHGTTEALIDEVNDGILTNNPAITCYIHCLFESFSMIDDDGELDTEMLLGILPEKIQEMGRDLVEECSKLTGADGCDKMFNIGQCVLKKRPEVWFLI